ncbi:MAG: hypothetical protein HY430_02740 [Candidatus Levybacteria bacterium]|nr:hypothetical protein [Candidatus Levybacteria bacterium]
MPTAQTVEAGRYDLQKHALITERVSASDAEPEAVHIAYLMRRNDLDPRMDPMYLLTKSFASTGKPYEVRLFDYEAEPHSYKAWGEVLGPEKREDFEQIQKTPEFQALYIAEQGIRMDYISDPWNEGRTLHFEQYVDELIDLPDDLKGGLKMTYWDSIAKDTQRRLDAYNESTSWDTRLDYKTGATEIFDASADYKDRLFHENAAAVWRMGELRAMGYTGLTVADAAVIIEHPALTILPQQIAA